MEQVDKRPKHHEREDLTGEHKLGDAGQAILAILFGAVWLADTFWFKYTTFLNDAVPNSIRAPIGIALLVISGYLAMSTLKIVFGEVRETPAVIREGAYKYSRHPMYFSELLLYLGLLSISISLAAALVWIVAIVFLYKICRYEERLLLARFGDEYRKYMREVPLWIPCLYKVHRRNAYQLVA